MECSGSYMLELTREGKKHFGVSDYMGYFVYGEAYESVRSLYVQTDLMDVERCIFCMERTSFGSSDTNELDKKMMEGYSFINSAYK